MMHRTKYYSLWKGVHLLHLEKNTGFKTKYFKVKKELTPNLMVFDPGKGLKRRFKLEFHGFESWWHLSIASREITV